MKHMAHAAKAFQHGAILWNSTTRATTVVYY
jgi:hypothetical protein